MPAQVVVVGGGIGGLLTANLLAKRLDRSQASIRLIDATGVHVFQPGWLYVALDQARPRWLARPTRSLLRKRVDLAIDRAIHFDLDRRRVALEKNGSIPFDYLVIATGVELDRSAIPAGSTHDFYSSAGAERLRDALREFRGGNLVVSVPPMPFKCPPAPVEFTLLVEEQLRRRGLRERTSISYLSPLPRAFPIESVAGMVEDHLNRRRIEAVQGFDLIRVDAEERNLIAADGRSVPFDLAVVIPPNRGAQVVVESGLGTAQGWIPADPKTLAVRGTENAYVVGDASDLPTSKNGSTAHFEAPRVTEQIVAGIEGRVPDPVRARYGGLVICPLEVGDGRATVLVFDYDRPPRPLRPRRVWHAATWLFNRIYWLTVRSGRL